MLPAAVAGAYEATGHDIYDQAQVRREIVELRAAIEPGDSGGPLILEDGTIGGLVFAESRTDPDVGYALSPVAISIRVSPAIGRTGRRRRGPMHRLTAVTDGRPGGRCRGAPRPVSHARHIAEVPSGVALDTIW